MVAQEKIEHLRQLIAALPEHKQVLLSEYILVRYLERETIVFAMSRHDSQLFHANIFGHSATYFEVLVS